MCQEFRDRNEHVHWAAEKVSMNKTEFDQASFVAYGSYEELWKKIPFKS